MTQRNSTCTTQPDRACQARYRRDCIWHASPGTDLCPPCARAEKNGEHVPRIAVPRITQGTGNAAAPVLAAIKPKPKPVPPPPSPFDDDSIPF